MLINRACTACRVVSKSYMYMQFFFYIKQFRLNYPHMYDSRFPFTLQQIYFSVILNALIIKLRQLFIHETAIAFAKIVVAMQYPSESSSFCSGR